MRKKTRGSCSKFFCLHCFKTFKSAGSCCNWPLYKISYKARPPKRSASKNEWREFFNLFLHGTYATKGQMKRIIEIRKEYGLNTLDQEREYKAFIQKHNESFKFLDIKRHESLYVATVNDNNNDITLFVRAINKLVMKFDLNQTNKKFNLNRKYFMVPVHANEGYKSIFPPSLDKYNIYKVSVLYKSSIDKFEFKILTNNIDEVYPLYKSNLPNNNTYSLRQRFLIFDTKEEAMAFRYKYLCLLIPMLKAEKKDLFKELSKKANADYNRVSRIFPELLI